MKSYRRFLKNAKAVSPVIATIIIVAIAIVMSIAVAYWMLGLGRSFTTYEKVEFSNAYVTGTQAGGYIIHMDMKNTGSAAATVSTNVTAYNGKPDTYYSVGGVHFTWTGAGAGGLINMEPGAAATATVTLPTSVASGVQGFTSGMTLELMIHTTGGKDYPKVVTLP